MSTSPGLPVRVVALALAAVASCGGGDDGARHPEDAGAFDLAPLDVIEAVDAVGAVDVVEAASDQMIEVPPTPGAAAIATDLEAPWGLAADDTHVYWTDVRGGRIGKAPVGGGSTVTLASGQAAPFRLTIDSASVYWVNAGTDAGGRVDGAVAKVPLDGGPVKILASDQKYPTFIAVDGENVYWSSSGTVGADGIAMRDGSVQKTPLLGGTVMPVAASEYVPNGLLVHAGSIYWASGGLRQIRRASTTGGARFNLTELETAPNQLTLAGEVLYWTNFAGEVLEMPVAGGAPVSFATDRMALGGLAADDDHVYWTSSTQRGSVLRAPRAGGAPTVLATDQRNPRAIALSAQHVFWTNGGDRDAKNGAVMRLAK